MASVQHAIVNTPTTRMRIGSTSKHFACMAALLLAERGKLDLDAPACRYIEELDQPYNQHDMPTLRQFMRHTSGRNCGLELAVMANGHATMPKGYLIGAMARQRGRCFPLGHGQLYNNGGYHLLSVAIERASGQPFGQFLRDELFAPLGMIDTECVPDFVQLVPRMASLHVPEPDGGWRLGYMPVEDLLGEGSIVSTIDDMLRWLAHMNGAKRVGSDATWRQMLDVAPLENGRASTYTLGLFRHDYRGVEVIHHGGTVAGGNSQMLTAPAEALDIVIMNNGVPASTQQLTRDVLDAVLGERFTGAADPLARAEDFRHMSGARYYDDRTGAAVGFDELPDGTLGLSLWHVPSLPVLRTRSDGTLSARFEDIAAGPIEFAAADLAPQAGGEAPATLHMKDMGMPVTLSRLPIQGTDAGAIAPAITGTYRCPDLAADAEIRSAEAGLVLRIRGEYSGWQEHALRPLSNTLLVVEGGPGLGLGAVTNGRIAHFYIDSLRARRLEFIREERA
jgi:CubicO group peptidase (beta-lactamase class C family)